MNRKSSLSLIEQLVMILVFAIAGAICLGVFGQINRISQETSRKENAVLLAQNAAALLQCGKDPLSLETGELTLTVEPLKSPVPGLMSAAAILISHEGECIFRLETGWQEVAP